MSKELSSDQQPNPIGRFLKLCQGLTAAQIGNLITEYVHESAHGNWEGFDQDDMIGIEDMLSDIVTYHDNAIRLNREQFNKPGFSGSAPFCKA